MRHSLLLLLLWLGVAAAWAERPDDSRFDRDRDSTWARYFESLSDDFKRRALNAEFNLLQTHLMQKNTDSKALGYLALLQRIRRHLPNEIRWLLAAAEIDHDLLSAETAADAKNALEKLYMDEKFSLSLLESNYLHRLSYEHRPLRGRATQVQLNLPSLREFFYLFRMWNRLPLISSPQQMTHLLEQRRIMWARAVCRHSDLAFTDFPRYRDLLNEFAPPAMRKFSSSQNTEDFFLQLIITVRRLKEQSGKAPVGQEHVIPSLLATLGAWLNADAIYVFQNMDRLLRLGVINPREVIFRSFSAREVEDLRQMARRPRLDIDSYLLVTVALLNSLDVTDIDFGRALEEALSILNGAAMNRGTVRVSQFTFMSQYLAQDSYLAILGAFYELFGTKKQLPQAQALRLLGMHTLHVPILSEEAWFDWERNRLRAVENALPPAEFKEELTRQVSGEKIGTLHDKMLAGRYLRENMKVNDLGEIVLRTKRKAMGRKTLSARGPSIEVWEQNNGELIQVVGALDPLDRDLRRYLIDTYITQRVDGPIGARSALLMLPQLGRSTESIQDMAVVKPGLLRRLRSVQAGDSDGSFRVFLRLFPEEGVEIHRILFLHRSETSKLKLMMLTLIQEAEANPQILLELQRAGTLPTTQRALYQGHSLEAWLEHMIQARKNLSPTCSERAEASP